MYVAPTWNSFYEIKDSVLFEIKIKSFLRKTQIEELLEPKINAGTFHVYHVALPARFVASCNHVPPPPPLESPLLSFQFYTTDLVKIMWRIWTSYQCYIRCSICTYCYTLSNNYVDLYIIMLMFAVILFCNHKYL